MKTEWEIYTLKRGRELLDRFGGNDWRIRIDTRPKNRRIGVCKWNKTEIGVSKWWLDLFPDLERCLEKDTLYKSDYHLRSLDDCLIHEIAHINHGGHRLDWKRHYTNLLFKHFDDEWTVRLLLGECGYCHQRVDRLIEEVSNAHN